MNMKHFITLTIALIVSSLFAHAFDSSNGRPVLYTRSHSKDIHSVQINNFARKPYYPMFELGSQEFVTLKFDDISGLANTYSYKIIHCNSQWQPDDMSESQCISGFTGSYPCRGGRLPLHALPSRHRHPYPEGRDHFHALGYW